MSKTMKLIRIIARLVCLLGFASGLHATQTCSTNIPESTLTTGFIDHGDGTVTHSATGLMWKRCAENQTWNAGSCSGSSGSPGTMTWVNALRAARNSTTAGYGDWRLPNARELGSIVETKCNNPAINLSVFPDAPAWSFWSASTYSAYANSAWFVDFSSGGLFPSDGKNGLLRVRLVRSGQSFDSFDAHPNPNPINMTPILMLLLDN
jgi:hypothetical protein